MESRTPVMFALAALCLLAAVEAKPVEEKAETDAVARAKKQTASSYPYDNMGYSAYSSNRYNPSGIGSDPYGYNRGYNGAYSQQGYQGYNQGYNSAYPMGRSYNPTGYNQGYQGYNQGGYQGYNQGYNQGYQQPYSSYPTGSGYNQGGYNSQYNQGGYNSGYNSAYPYSGSSAYPGVGGYQSQQYNRPY